MGTIIFALAAQLLNVVVCLIYATTPDTFLTTNAIFMAALIYTVERGNRHG